MNIQNLVKQIQEKTLAANDNLEDATNSTRAMREGNRRAARESLADLKQEYRKQLLTSASYVVVSGSQSKELEAAIESESLALTVDSEEFYQELLSKIDERSYMNRPVDGTFFNALANSIEDIAREIGIKSYPQILFKSEYHQIISSKDQVLKLLKLIVNKDLGSELIGIHAVNKVMDKALKREQADSFTPLFLTAEDKTLALALSNDLGRLSSNVFLVCAGKTSKSLKNVQNSLSIDEVNKETIEQLLEAIRSKTV